MAPLLIPYLNGERTENTLRIVMIENENEAGRNHINVMKSSNKINMQSSFELIGQRYLM